MSSEVCIIVCAQHDGDASETKLYVDNVKQALGTYGVRFALLCDDDCGVARQSEYESASMAQRTPPRVSVAMLDNKQISVLVKPTETFNAHRFERGIDALNVASGSTEKAANTLSDAAKLVVRHMRVASEQRAINSKVVRIIHLGVPNVDTTMAALDVLGDEEVRVELISVVSQNESVSTESNLPQLLMAIGESSASITVKRVENDEFDLTRATDAWLHTPTRALSIETASGLHIECECVCTKLSHRATVVRVCRCHAQPIVEQHGRLLCSAGNTLDVRDVRDAVRFAGATLELRQQPQPMASISARFVAWLSLDTLSLRSLAAATRSGHAWSVRAPNSADAHAHDSTIDEQQRLQRAQAQFIALCDAARARHCAAVIEHDVAMDGEPLVCAQRSVILIDETSRSGLLFSLVSPLDEISAENTLDAMDAEELAALKETNAYTLASTALLDVCTRTFAELDFTAPEASVRAFFARSAELLQHAQQHAQQSGANMSKVSKHASHSGGHASHNASASSENARAAPPKSSNKRSASGGGANGKKPRKKRARQANRLQLQ